MDLATHVTRDDFFFFTEFACAGQDGSNLFDLALSVDAVAPTAPSTAWVVSSGMAFTLSTSSSTVDMNGPCGFFGFSTLRL